MNTPFDPVIAIKKFNLADNRAGQSRVPGQMSRIVNLYPNLTGEERTRPGYSAYASTDGGSTPGQDMPTGFEVLKIGSIQSPITADVHVKFVNNSGQKIYMNPWWSGSTEQNTDLLINESKTFTPAAGSFNGSLGAPPITFTITGSDALNLSKVNGYYTGWSLVDTSSGLFYNNTVVTAYTYSSAASGTSVFNLAAFDYAAFNVTDNYALYRNFHDNSSFTPAYNNDLANPISFNCENSVIRFSGGQSATTGNRGIWANPHLKKTFFPGSLFAFTVENTYISERELKAVDCMLSLNMNALSPTDSSVLTADSTYWIAVAPVYDGYQIGALQKYETYTAYSAALNSPQTWTGTTGSISFDGTYTHFVFNGSNTFNSGAGLSTSAGFYAQSYAGHGWTLEDNTHSNLYTVASYSYSTASNGISDFAVLGNYTGAGNSITDSWQVYTSAPIANHVTNNYVLAGNTMNVNLQFYIQTMTGKLNKRITGFAVYCAVDSGDTRVQGRQNDYFFQQYVSMIAAGNPDGWYSGAQLQTLCLVTINQNSILAQGNDYQTDSGYIISSPDTMYSYSSEEIVGTRRVMSNCYVTSESLIDRENVFTNPLGGNTTIGNSGVIQPDIYSNEEGIYRLRVDPTLGIQINGLVATSIEEFVVLRSAGVIRARILNVGSLPNLLLTIVSDEVGCSTLNGFATDDSGYIYFPSYYDIYRYKDGAIEPLIERADKNDWLDTYRNVISVTDKQNASLCYIPELKAVIFQFANQASTYEQKQYIFFPTYGWREIRFNESNRVPQTSFKYFDTLSIGQTIGVTATSPAVKRLLWKYSSGLSSYLMNYSDDGTAIAPYFDTGDFIIADGRDLKFNKIHVLKTIDSTPQGQLDCQIYLDGSLVRLYQNISMTDVQTIINGLSDDIRIGYTFRFVYNVNTTNPERLNAGSKLQFNSLLLYGDSIPHFRVTENTGTLTRGGDVPILGTINGIREVTITTANTPQTFTFDVPFTETYVGSLATEPAYRFDVDSAHPVVSGVEDPTTNITVTITARTLTTITISSAEDNTIVRYSIS